MRDFTRGQRRWLTLFVVCLAQLMNTLDMTIVNVALPVIQADLHFSQSNLTWVVNAYLVSFGGFLLLSGRLGDLVGRKRVFLAGVVLFTTASALCGLAQDQSLLVAARFLQGIGGALSASVVVPIIITQFSDPMARARAMSTYAFVAVGGGSLGLVLGGVLVQAVDWHWIFFMNLPIGLAAVLLGRALIDDNVGLGLQQGVDALGAVLVTAGLMLGIYAIVEAPARGWTSAGTLSAVGAALLLLALFGVLEGRLERPLMPVRVLRLGHLTTSSIVRGLAAIGLFGSFFFSSLYLERVLGYGAFSTGTAFLPQTVAFGILSLGTTARLSQRYGALRTLSAGLLSMLAGLVVLVGTNEQDRYFPRLLVAFVLLGIGGGLSFMPLLTVALAEVPAEDAGLASGVVNVAFQISAALGLAVLGSVASERTTALLAGGTQQTGALIGGFQLAYGLAGLCVAAGLIAAQVALRRTPRALALTNEAQEQLAEDLADHWPMREAA